MNDTARHTIPRRLDDPERWLFWTVDEAAALMGPALLGLAANQFVPGLIAGVGGWLLLAPGQARRRRQHRALRPLLVPARLRAAPARHAAEPCPALCRMRRSRVRTFRMKRAVMETGFRRARDARIALGGLLVLSMTANLALGIGLAGREAVTVMVPAVTGPAWEVGGGRAGAGTWRTWRAPRR